MFNKFHYFNNHLSQGFVALFTGRMLMFVGNGLVGLFMPIFLLIKFNYNINFVFIYYIIGYFLYLTLLPLGSRLLNTIGLRRSIRLSVFFNAGVYLCFFLLDYYFWFFIILSFVLLTIYRITFWYPFHVDFAKFTKANDRGKEVSMLWASKSILGILLPILAGGLITYFGFNVVFIMAIIVYLSVYIPFITLPRTKERFSWSYRQTVRNFFKRKNRALVIANLANGAENAVAIIIWPIFIWQVLNGDYLSVGALSSVIVSVAVLLQLIMGKYTDIFNKRKLIHWASVFYALGWFFKVFVLTAYQIFLAGAYHSFAQIFKDTPFDALNYDLMADHGHYVDEYTVLKEIAVNLGKVFILLFAIVIAFNFGINWTFILAALASLFINLL